MNVAHITPELLTVPEAATLLNIGHRTLCRWSADGKAPSPIKITPGRRGCVRYRRADLLQWINAGCPDLREAEGGDRAIA